MVSDQIPLLVIPAKHNPARTSIKAAQTPAERITGGLAALHLVEDIILPNGLHRLKFQQRGRVPDMEEIKRKYGPKDGQHVYAAAWLDEKGVGRAQMVWKEYQQEPLIKSEPKTEENPDG